MQALVAPGTQTIVTHGGGLMPDAEITSPGLTANDLQQLKNKNREKELKNKPKAYLNLPALPLRQAGYVFFDKQLNFVEEGSGVKRVDGEAGELETLSSGKVVAKKNGYVYVFTSNESSQDVLFDNMSVMQITGPVLEETHYYPFGLTMSAISTTAPLKLEGRRKFNGIEFNHKEFSDGSGLDLYTAYYRSLDPQIGRCLPTVALAQAGWQADTRQTYSSSPYAAMGNNPLFYMDFLGDSTVPVGDVQGNWSNFDTQEHDIGLNGVTVTASGGYNLLYTGVSADPLKVNWAKRGKHGGGFETNYQVGYDGNLLEQLYFHYQFGKGSDYIINASLLNFSRTSQKELGLKGMTVGEERGVNLFNSSINTYSLAFGRIRMAYKGNNQFAIKNDKFDFDYQAGASFRRNAGTFAGGLVFGRIYNIPIPMPGLLSLQPNIFFGGQFRIIFKGAATIPK